MPTQSFNMPLVTGANGFLGSYVVSTLLLKGCEVKAMKRPNADLSEFDYISSLVLGEQKSELLPKLIWVEGDLTDILSLDSAFSGVDLVFHCGAKIAFKGTDKEMLSVNAEGTANVVNACLRANVKKLCYVSSTAALGRTDDAKTITEETEWVEDENNTAYAVSKHRAELEVWRGIEEGLNAVIVNPGIILGAGNWEKGSAGMLTSIYRKLKFYTRGQNGFVGAEDVANILVSLGFSDIVNQRYLLISENLTYQTLFSYMAGNLGVKQPGIEIKASYLPWIKWLFRVYSLLNRKSNLSVETLKTSVKSFSYDNSKIKNLAYTFQPIEEVVKKMSLHFLNDRA